MSVFLNGVPGREEDRKVKEATNFDEVCLEFNTWGRGNGRGITAALYCKNAKCLRDVQYYQISPAFVKACKGRKDHEVLISCRKYRDSAICGRV